MVSREHFFEGLVLVIEKGNHSQRGENKKGHSQDGHSMTLLRFRLGHGSVRYCFWYGGLHAKYCTLKGSHDGRNCPEITLSR